MSVSCLHTVGKDKTKHTEVYGVTNSYDDAGMSV